ncbi:hypothetical protein ES707_00537 [subsurface metagenome]
MSTVLETTQDVEDFVRGCALLGTGGGGDPKKGYSFLSKTLEQKGKISWIGPDKIQDDEWTVSLFYMGSIAPKDLNLANRLKEHGLQVRVENELVKAMRELESHSGISPQYVVPGEIGGVNTPAPIAAAYELGLKVVDGDFGGGRAIPEMTQSLVSVLGHETCPLVFCDYAGSVTIVKEAPSCKMAERIGKFLSAASFGLVGSAGIMLKGKDAKQTVKPGTLTRALEVGRVIRKARETGEDPVAATAQGLNGWILFKGEVTNKEWEDRDGYMYGHYQVMGLDEFSGHQFKVWFKNENHMTWLDDTPYVMSPDIIAAVHLSDAEPITNTDIAKGDRIAVIGTSICPEYRSEKGLAVLGPRHFGFDLEYTPIENLIKKL